MEDDEDTTVFQTEEDRKRIEKEILGKVLEDDSESDAASNDHARCAKSK